MQHCEEYRTLISALIDDEISEGERAELMAHLAECGECRAAMDDMIAVHEAMGTLECTAPAGFADAVMAKVRETKQETPEKKVILFPHWKRWAGLAACCAVIILGVLTMDGGFMSAENTADCAAPEMAYSTDSAAQKTEDALTGGAYSVPEAPAAGDAGSARSQSDADDGVLEADAAPTSSEYAQTAEYAALLTTGSQVAAQWVEETLGEAWGSGMCYLLTADQYAALREILVETGEAFSESFGTEDSDLYQLLAE